MKKVMRSDTEVKVGTEILKEHPFAYVLSSRYATQRCDHCFEMSNALLTCSGCSAICYCDKICQKKGWYFHKRECRNMKRIAPKIIPDAGRLLARIIYKLDKGGAREQCFYSPRQFRVFLDLMSHYNEVKVDKKRMEHFESLYVVLTEFFGEETLPNPVELLQMYGRMVVNTYCILDAEMQTIGSGLYIAASIIDHSCQPNAVAIFNGTTLSIRSLVDIDNLDWSKIFISYIDLLKMPLERIKELQATYYFSCECSRCLDIEESSLMKATLCQNESCRSTIPNGCSDKNVLCPKCKDPIKPCDWEKIMDAVTYTDQQLETMKDMYYLDICRICLKKQEGLFDKMNMRKVRVLDVAMESSVELGLWESALENGQELIIPFRRYYGHYHPLTGILLMKLGKLALFLTKMNQARHWLKEAMTVLLITHGNTHPLVCNELVSYIRQCNF